MFQCREFKLNNPFEIEHTSLSQSSFRRTFRSPYTRRWRANCDTLWTAATGIKSRRRRRFVDVRGNIRACRSSRRRASTRRATSTGTSSEKHLWRKQRDVWSNEKTKWWISLRSKWLIAVFSHSCANWNDRSILNNARDDGKRKIAKVKKIILICKIIFKDAKNMNQLLDRRKITFFQVLNQIQFDRTRYITLEEREREKMS